MIVKLIAGEQQVVAGFEAKEKIYLGSLSFSARIKLIQRRWYESEEGRAGYEDLNLVRAIQCPANRVLRTALLNTMRDEI